MRLNFADNCSFLDIDGIDSFMLSGIMLEQLAPVTDATAPGHEVPLVSIVIPCYKGERYLAEAIESCLNQTHRNIEVIVVDDASPDDCHGIAHRYAEIDPRVRLVRRETNGGVARAFNLGFQHARGAFHTRLAQDDRLKPEAVAAMLRQLLIRLDAGLIYADMETIDGSGQTQNPIVLPDPADALSWGNGLGVCAMWRRSVWDTVGEFDPSFDAAEDFDYWVRVSERFEITKVNAALLQFRVHEAMGSIVHTGKQERASRAIRRRQLANARWGSRRYWTILRSLSHHYYSFAYDHSVAGDHRGAIGRIGLSILYWPFPYPRARVKASLARIRMAVMILWRFIRGSANPPLTSHPRVASEARASS